MSQNIMQNIQHCSPEMSSFENSHAQGAQVLQAVSCQTLPPAAHCALQHAFGALLGGHASCQGLL